jgi:hypothetical protein
MQLKHQQLGGRGGSLRLAPTPTSSTGSTLQMKARPLDIMHLLYKRQMLHQLSSFEIIATNKYLKIHFT